MDDITSYARVLGENAREASRQLRALPRAKRDGALKALAKSLIASQAEILAENDKDMEESKERGLSPSMLDRLLLTPARIQGIVESVDSIAAFPDPLGKSLGSRKRKDGLKIARVTVPIGTILFIFESRPNVTIDGGALCLKSGNAVILRGGKEAARTNAVFARLFQAALKSKGIDERAVQLVNKPDHGLVDLLLTDVKHVDLVIPRGGERLIHSVVEKARIPVIKHYKGVCHTYVDKTADLKAAERIVVNAKAQRPSACNAMETLLIDGHIKPAAVKRILDSLVEHNVELRGDEFIRNLHPSVKPAVEADWGEEFSDLRLAVKMVDGVDEAVEHINKYGTGHTDAVLAKSPKVQKAFLAGVDSASLMVNASTRFADGGEYGLGAEVGISTDKLHARGPMGLDSLTTYRWIVEGTGHVRK
ncbi:MAG TPA: glutamate-5-semialdehyde dehydrogenase [Fibrobacteria bacterium]|nr:glutamate-5-semialdehyde dehydrogenase [Fibrobacteria bacterium]